MSFQSPAPMDAIPPPPFALIIGGVALAAALGGYWYTPINSATRGGAP